MGLERWMGERYGSDGDDESSVVGTHADILVHGNNLLDPRYYSFVRTSPNFRIMVSVNSHGSVAVPVASRLGGIAVVL